MKIKALTSFAGIDFSMAPGEVQDLPEAIAEDLVNAGYAEKITGKAAIENATPKEETDESKSADNGDNPKPVKRGSKRTK